MMIFKLSSALVLALTISMTCQEVGGKCPFGYGSLNEKDVKEETNVGIKRSNPIV